MKAGLTGGIASGKSAVAAFFRELGAYVVNADQIAHFVLELPAVVQSVTDRFGTGVLDAVGAVDRKKLGQIVFADPEARQWLAEVVHPATWIKLDQQVEWQEGHNPAALVIAEVPLLLETGQAHRYGPLVLAWCPQALQLERLVRRDSLSQEEAQQRLASQMPIDEKRSSCDFIIDTSLTLADTRRQVQEVYAALTFINLRGDR